MKKQFLEAGKIVNTHGVNGNVKIQPWTSTPDFLLGFKKIYIDDKPVKIIKSNVSKDCVIVSLENIDSIEDAIRLKNKVIYIDRNDALLGKDEHFVQDIIGLKVIDFESGTELGAITEVISLPANDVYVVNGSREILVPAVPEFIVNIDIESGFISVRLIDGM